MIIWIWLFVALLLILSAVSLLWFVANHPRIREVLKTAQNGIIGPAPQGNSPKTSNRNYQIELWKWETMHDADVCEDCLERSSWPAMDIADWMKEGMPRTSEAETKCGENCRCQLVRYYPGVSSKKYFNQP